MIFALGKLLSCQVTEDEQPLPPTVHIRNPSLPLGRQEGYPTDTGTWGYGLYQSDADLEMLDLVTAEAARMMSDPKCLHSFLVPGSFTLRAPIDKGAAVQQLETGILHHLIRRFNHHKNHGAVVILGVVSMELGVKINPEDLLAMKMALMRWEIYEVKRDQIIRALNGYSNDGTEWRFDGKRMMEPAVVSDIAELPKRKAVKEIETGKLKTEDEDGEGKSIPDAIACNNTSIHGN
ncbi:MAG: hypothetical protein Q9224_005484 [Gallowayella concinna]